MVDCSFPISVIRGSKRAIVVNPVCRNAARIRPRTNLIALLFPVRQTMNTPIIGQINASESKSKLQWRTKDVVEGSDSDPSRS